MKFYRMQRVRHFLACLKTYFLPLLLTFWTQMMRHRQNFGTAAPMYGRFQQPPNSFQLARLAVVLYQDFASAAQHTFHLSSLYTCILFYIKFDHRRP
jgi:hypothetical protein